MIEAMHIGELKREQELYRVLSVTSHEFLHTREAVIYCFTKIEIQ